MGPADLNEILADLYNCKSRGVVVGPGDDAGIFKYRNNFLVETVDVITPIVDDPYTFGAISAANSVSDIYAMGGTPLTALAILGFASCDFGPPVIKRLFNGAVDKLSEAGVCLIGGHSIEDTEFKLGFAVTGITHKGKILRLRGAAVGDLLLITKPLGTGILTSAFKKGKLRKSALQKVISWMLRLNKPASEAAVKAGATAATDVTGFGLLGHALTMAKSSRVGLKILCRHVPLMPNVKDFVAAGIVPKGARRNLDFCSRSLNSPDDFSKQEALAFSDPQTSGGLLIALPEKGLNKFDRVARKERMRYWIIGEVVKGSGKIFIE